MCIYVSIVLMCWISSFFLFKKRNISKDSFVCLVMLSIVPMVNIAILALNTVIVYEIMVTGRGKGSFL